jgi:hypothetical protein
MPTELLTGDQVKNNYQKSVRDSSQQTIAKRSFIICENCHWCATLMDTSRILGIDFSSCKNCKSQQPLSSVPIADNETFTFSYSEKHGVELDFMPEK